jgi:hypothetical protein
VILITFSDVLLADHKMHESEIILAKEQAAKLRDKIRVSVEVVEEYGQGMVSI